MISIELSPDIERQFLGVIRDNYDGNSQSAIVTLLRLHRNAIKKYRKMAVSHDA